MNYVLAVEHEQGKLSAGFRATLARNGSRPGKAPLGDLSRNGLRVGVIVPVQLIKRIAHFRRRFAGVAAEPPRLSHMQGNGFLFCFD